MRILGIVALGAALVGCAASRQEVAARLGDQFIGQNVDFLVVQFGPRFSKWPATFELTFFLICRNELLCVRLSYVPELCASGSEEFEAGSARW